MSYVFDTRPLTNKRRISPPTSSPETCRASATGSTCLLLWATLAIAALSLLLVPLVFGWRAISADNPDKFRTIVYFACLGAGYIMVEVVGAAAVPLIAASLGLDDVLMLAVAA